MLLIICIFVFALSCRYYNIHSEYDQDVHYNTNQRYWEKEKDLLKIERELRERQMVNKLDMMEIEQKEQRGIIIKQANRRRGPRKAKENWNLIRNVGLNPLLKNPQGGVPIRLMSMVNAEPNDNVDRITTAITPIPVAITPIHSVFGQYRPDLEFPPDVKNMPQSGFLQRVIDLGRAEGTLDKKDEKK